MAAFVILLAVTGFFINHAHTLGWDQRALRSTWLLSLYGVELEVPSAGAHIHGVWYVRVADQLYRDENPLGECRGALVGVVPVSSALVAAQCADVLYLLTPEGELIERLEGQPETMRAIALSGERLLGRGDENLWEIDVDAGEWSRVDPVTVVAWSALIPIPGEKAERWRVMSAPADLTWERFLLDLHSGRLFGPLGVAVVDLAGLLMVFLAVSGAWALLTRPRRHG